MVLGGGPVWSPRVGSRESDPHHGFAHFWRDEINAPGPFASSPDGRARVRRVAESVRPHGPVGHGGRADYIWSAVRPLIRRHSVSISSTDASRSATPRLLNAASSAAKRSVNLRLAVRRADSGSTSR